MKRGFTLVEMLVVIGIIAILIAASIGGFSHMTRTADRTKAQELVSNVATALTALYQQEGNWPKRLATNGGSDGQLDKDAAIPLALGKYFSLTTKGSGKEIKLAGLDQFGIVTPWATAVIKRRGTSAQLYTSSFLRPVWYGHGWPPLPPLLPMHHTMAVARTSTDSPPTFAPLMTPSPSRSRA